MLQDRSEAEAVIAALPASAVIGSKVRNAYGEDLGKVEELMIDRHRGCVAFAALSFGGLFGLGAKLFAIPWQALRVENEVVVLDIEREALENAPGFDRDHWPHTGDDAWLREVYIYYGHTPYWENT